MIRLDVEDYCMDCLDFEADVTKPERTVVYGDDTPRVTYQTDTVVRCERSSRCANLVRYLNKQVKGDNLNARPN